MHVRTRQAPRGLLLPLLFALGCGGQAPTSTYTTEAAVSESLAPGDHPDNSCGVVLRSVSRAAGADGYETDCSAGACRYVWRGEVDLGESLPEEATVRVLYRLASDLAWWESEALPGPSSTPGFRRFSFALSEHLFGPEEEAGGPRIELIAFAVLPGEVRLFDHNRSAGNTFLAPESGYSAYAGEVCQPVLGRISFFESFDHYAQGARRQGGYLEVDYDLGRLPSCRGTHNGYPAWDIIAFLRFSPGGQLITGSVRELISSNGTPTNEAVSRPLVARIPEDATEVEIWFLNYSGAGSSCQAWDSSYGDNYRFDIWPGEDDPRCADVQLETGAHTESEHMVHYAPHCLSYTLDEEHDARHCELRVDGFGLGHMGHYGMPIDWLVAYLSVGPTEGEVLGAGMFTRVLDRRTGAERQRFSLGEEVAPGVYKAGLNIFVTGFQGVAPVDLEVRDFAFFVDVRRPSGAVVRLWESRGGANYRWEDAFGLPTTLQYIPYGNVQWANDQAQVTSSRRACP